MAPFSERDSKCQIHEQQGGLDESQLQEFFLHELIGYIKQLTCMCLQ